MRIACVLSDGFEDSEFAKPYAALKDAGHEVVVIGTEKGASLSGKGGKEKAKVDVSIDDVRPDQFEALFVPGGYSPDHLRVDRRFVDFTKAIADADMPIMAICHGPQLLATAGAIRGRRLTAWQTIQEDLRKMGENVEDAEVVVDGGLVTSRKPDDIPAFNRESVALLEKVPARR